MGTTYTQLNNAHPPRCEENLSWGSRSRYRLVLILILILILNLNLTDYLDFTSSLLREISCVHWGSHMQNKDHG